MARCFKSVMRISLLTDRILDSFTAQHVPTRVQLPTWWRRRHFPPARLSTIFSVERPRGRMSIEPWRPALLATTTKRTLCKFKFDRRMSQCRYFTSAWTAVFNGTRNRRLRDVIYLGLRLTSLKDNETNFVLVRGRTTMCNRKKIWAIFQMFWRQALTGRFPLWWWRFQEWPPSVGIGRILPEA